MCWLIQRTAPQEPISYWGRMERWIARRRPLCFAQLLHPIPDGARRFESYDSAHERAEQLRIEQPLAYGEVIAVVPGPEAPA